LLFLAKFVLDCRDSARGGIMHRHLAVYPGSFDPITCGHLDIARRAANIFEHLIVAVAEHSGKNMLFSTDERAELVRASVADLPNVEIRTFSGLLTDFVRQTGARVIIRGLRAVSDFEYEFSMSLMNSHLAPEIETMFLPTSEGYSFISSSMIKEVYRLGGDVGDTIPPCVLQALAGKYHS